MDNSNARNLVNDLQLQYAYALDRKAMNGWLACFAEDGSYLCQTRENFQDNLPIGFMWDDCYARLKDRVKTIDEVWAGTAEDYQPRHFVQCLNVSAGRDGIIEAISNFVVFYTTNRGDSRTLATGEYHDRVRIAGDRPQFIAKQAILDQITVPRYLVYPI